MQALPQLIWLQSLESIIDCLLLMVVPKKLLLDAMTTRGYTYVLMVSLGIDLFEVESQILVERELLKYKWLLARAIVRKDTTGKPTRLVRVSVDSTSCVQVEVSFCESKKLFCAIFNSTLKFFGLLTKEGILLGVNQTALDFGKLQPQYFEYFYRASNVGNILGTGLEMAIVKKCVDIYQGKIFITSLLGFCTNLTTILSLNKKI